jgi:hypothetical protein
MRSCLHMAVLFKSSLSPDEDQLSASIHNDADRGLILRRNFWSFPIQSIVYQLPAVIRINCCSQILQCCFRHPGRELAFYMRTECLQDPLLWWSRFRQGTVLGRGQSDGASLPIASLSSSCADPRQLVHLAIDSMSRPPKSDWPRCKELLLGVLSFETRLGSINEEYRRRHDLKHWIGRVVVFTDR